VVFFDPTLIIINLGLNEKKYNFKNCAFIVLFENLLVVMMGGPTKKTAPSKVKKVVSKEDLLLAEEDPGIETTTDSNCPKPHPIEVEVKVNENPMSTASTSSIPQFSQEQVLALITTALQAAGVAREPVVVQNTNYKTSFSVRSFADHERLTSRKNYKPWKRMIDLDMRGHELNGFL
jgi:hypothetical protein